MKRSFPIFKSLDRYSKPYFRDDLFAGLTVGSVLIPQAMAYAMLAGLPPIYGLYASVVPLIIYSIFASSTKVAIGPVAISALLLFSGISAVSTPFTEEYISLVILAGIAIGTIQIVLGILRLGFLVNLLSHPVIAGFTSAAAIIIAGTQLPDLLGLTQAQAAEPLHNFSHVIKNMGSVKWSTLGISLTSIISILVLKRINKKIPGPLIVVVMGIIVSYFFSFENSGVQVVGVIPKGLPQLVFPEFDVDKLLLILPTVFTVTIIGIVESLGIAKVLELKHKDHVLKPDAELMALGLSKVGGAFFQAMPTSASFSRSAIHSESGNRTQVSTLLSVLLVIVTLLFLADAIRYLPKAILSSIIILSIIKLFDLKEMKLLWKTMKSDFWMLMATFICTLVLGIEIGVLCGVLFSICYVLYQASKPNISILDQIPGTEYYRNVDRYNTVGELSEFMILRFESQIFFVNAEYLRSELYKRLDNNDAIKYIIIDSSAITGIDSTGLHLLENIDEDLKKRNIELHLCGTIGVVRDALYLYGLMTEPQKHHASIHNAIQSIKAGHNISERILNPLQTNNE